MTQSSAEIMLPELPLLDLPLARSLLRRLLLTHSVGPGSRMIVAGDVDGDLVRYFNYLGIDATAPPGTLDRDGENSVSVAMVFARHWEAYRENLFGLSALQATARLLSCLRPGGTLIAVWRRSPVDDATGFHSANCLRRQLAHFDGQLLGDADCTFPGPWATVSALFHRPRDREMDVVALRVPTDRRSATDWERMACRAAQCEAATCCAWSQQSLTPSGQQRRVA